MSHSPQRLLVAPILYTLPQMGTPAFRPAITKLHVSRTVRDYRNAKRKCGVLRLMQAGALLLQPGDFILEQQFAALELGDLNIVDRRMFLSLLDLVFEAGVVVFKLSEVSLHRHIFFLLRQIGA
jgi:hypothetical protein